MTEELKPTAWMLCRKRDGFVRGVYSEKPTTESEAFAELDGDKYVPMVSAECARLAVEAERDRALAEVAKLKEWASNREQPYGWAVEDEIDDCISAIRRGI